MKRAVTPQLYTSAQNSRTKLVATFCVVSVLYVIAVTLSIVLSTRQYAFNLMLNIVLTVAYGWYVVYFATVTYRDIDKLCKLLKLVTNGCGIKEYLYFSEYGDKTVYQGVELYRVNFVDVNGNERTVYTFDTLKLTRDTKYVVESADNVVVSYGEADCEKVK